LVWLPREAIHEPFLAILEAFWQGIAEAFIEMGRQQAGVYRVTH